MSLVLDGSAGVTFPTGSGTQGAQSKVLQVVQGNLNTQATTTSTSPVTTGITASITPLFSTSKILVLANVQGVFIGGTSVGGNFYVYRNSTSVQNFGVAYMYYAYPLTGISTSYLDSPATTSSTSYTIYFNVYTGSGTYYINNNGPASTITLMEIAQ